MAAKYDIGGGEAPEVGFIVVDILSNNEMWMQMGGAWRDQAGNPVSKDHPWILADVREPGWTEGLEMAEEIRISKMLRYVAWQNGYLGDEPDVELPIMYGRFETLAKEIHNLAKDRCELILFDHLEVIGRLMEPLIRMGWRLWKMEIINERDSDYPSEWRIELRKEG